MAAISRSGSSGSQELGTSCLSVAQTWNTSQCFCRCIRGSQMSWSECGLAETSRWSHVGCQHHKQRLNSQNRNTAPSKCFLRWWVHMLLSHKQLKSWCLPITKRFAFLNSILRKMDDLCRTRHLSNVKQPSPWKTLTMIIDNPKPSEKSLQHYPKYFLSWVDSSSFSNLKPSLYLFSLKWSQNYLIFTTYDTRLNIKLWHK